MDERLRAIRRRRRRERRLLRRIGNLGPLALVGLAYLLSAGVVEIMEVPPPPVEESNRALEKGVAELPARGPRSLSAPDTRPELPDMLSTSILDSEVSGPPEDDRDAPRGPESDELLPELAPLAPVEGEPSEEPEAFAPVPEPGSALLVATGLVLLVVKQRRRPGAARGPCRYSTAISSTSKVRTAPGGITPGTPVSP